MADTDGSTVERLDFDEDADAWLAVYNAVATEDPTSREEWAAFLAELPWSAAFLVREDGRVVGVAAVGPRFSAPGSDHGEIELAVLPGDRRRGHGTALFGAVAAEARRHQLTGLRIHLSAAEADGIAYLERRGFREIGREQQVALDLASAEPLGAQPPEGVEIVTLAERPDLAESAWRVTHETVPDIPGDTPEEPLPFERWRSLQVDAPWAMPAAFFIAVAGGEAIGSAAIAQSAAMPDTGFHRLTGVRRAWRRRGVAAALKDAQIRWAKDAGLRRLVAENELRNEPIRRLNARLGYAPLPERVLMAGPLPEEA